MDHRGDDFFGLLFSKDYLLKDSDSESAKKSVLKNIVKFSTVDDELMDWEWWSD